MERLGVSRLKDNFPTNVKVHLALQKQTSGSNQKQNKYQTMSSSSQYKHFREVKQYLYRSDHTRPRLQQCVQPMSDRENGHSHRI